MVTELIIEPHKKWPFREFLALLGETPAREVLMGGFYQNHSVLSAVGLSMLQAVAMTIRVDIAEFECLHGCVRRLLMNMSNQPHDVHFSQAASRWISVRFRSEFVQQPATRSRAKLLIARVTSRHSGVAAWSKVAMTTRTKSMTGRAKVPRGQAAAPPPEKNSRPEKLSASFTTTCPVRRWLGCRC